MRSAFVIFLGALVLLVVLNKMPVNGTAYFAISCAVVGFAAAWLTRLRTAGLASAVGVAALWFIEVLTRSWLQGDLARAFPDCDPCGLQGYAVRMTIVAVMGLATFGLVAAVFGWLGAFARQRGFLSPQRS